MRTVGTGTESTCDVRMRLLLCGATQLLEHPRFQILIRDVLILSPTHQLQRLWLTSSFSFFLAEGKSIDWDMMVKLRDFEAAIADSQKKLNTTKGSDLATGGEGNMTSSGKKDAGVAIAEAPSRIAEANAFRIPTKASMGDTQEHSEDDVKDHTRISPVSLFDRISLSFPSAFRQSSGRVIDESFPFVAIDPTFIEQIGDEELFLALDSLSLSLFQREFLVRDASTGNSLAENQSEDTTLPLSALLLSKMESSIVESFSASEQKGISELSVHSKPSSDSTIYASAHGTESSANEDQPEDAQPTTTLSIVKDLISRSRSVEDSAANRVALKEYLADAFACGTDDSVRLAALFFTPLQWLAPADEGISHDLAFMDDRVEKALRRISELNVAKAAIGASHPMPSDHTDAPTEHKTKATPQKKKKRKSRRRSKVRSTLLSFQTDLNFLKL